jgi:hypothetical protein
VHRASCGTITGQPARGRTWTGDWTKIRASWQEDLPTWMAGFEDVVKAALRAADVLGTDETPARLTDQATREPGRHNPHVYTVRTLCAYTSGGADLVWYGAARIRRSGWAW